MGLLMSYMGKGMPSMQILNILTDKVYEKFGGSNTKNPDEFQMAILDVFNAFNASLPGMHYNAPSHSEVLKLFEKWEEATEEETKKNLLSDFIMEKVNLSKLDEFTLVTGLVTPPAAMALKKAGESVPQIKMIKVIPDVLFVPTATLVALITVKFTRRSLWKNME